MAKKVSLIAQLQDKLDRANLLIEEHGVETDDLRALVQLGKATDKLQLYVHQALREALENSEVGKKAVTRGPRNRPGG